LQDFLELKKYYDSVRKQEILEEIEKQTEEYKTSAETLERYQEQMRSSDNEIAVLDYSYEQLKKQEEKLKKEIQIKKQDTNLLLMTGIGQELAKVQKQLKDNEEKRETLIKQINQCKSGQLEKRIRLERIAEELVQIVDSLSVVEEQRKEVLSAEEKKKTLMDVYGEQDLERLIQKIVSQKNASVISCETIRNEIEQKKRKYKVLEEGRVVAESETLMKVLQYINKYHGNIAVAGQDYLKELEEDKRQMLCRQISILPYAIVIREKFQEVCFDNRLSEIMSGDDYLVLFDETTMEEQHQVLYLTGEELRYEPEKLELRKQQLKQEIEELEKQYRRRLENEEILQEDYVFLLTLQRNDTPDKSMLEQKRKELEEMQKTWQTELETFKQQQLVWEQELERCDKEQVTLQQEERTFDSLTEYLQQEERLAKECASLEIQIKQKNQEYQQITRQVESEKHTQSEAGQRLVTLKQELEGIETKWAQTYAIFYKEKPDFEIQEGTVLYSANEVDVRLDALIESMNQEHASVADKEKLLKNYSQSMEQALGRIRYLSESPEKYQLLWEEQKLMKRDTEDLSKKKEEIRNADKKKEEKKNQIAKIASERDQLQGKITHGVSMISKKYGCFDAEIIDKQEVAVFLNENDALLSSIEEHMEVQNQKLKELEESGIAIQVLRKETENLMARGGIKADTEAGCMGAGVELKAEWKRLSGCFDSFIDERYRRTKEFQEELGMLVETLDKLKAQALAQEIKTHIHMPESVEDTQELIRSFEETNQFIQLEKERVLQGLEDMQMIKENFENQCIQTCVNIRTELERLDKLSRITMEDETIGMIQLKIPYVKEEQYQTRMTEYIDEIAKATDSFEKEEDKLKYLRNNLCWKRLFSVIVSDMNGIRMNLYKRERISGQSRYLPYEEAVGSTGQSQGIYIQFLISIINYISSIHSKNADAGRLKKTIFIDNPFGAAKDVYIWEPIFKLLKTNNVQLIVPARGVTPAITGRFDVNYILGQKLQNGRQQTVVVEYYSNVSGGELEYTNFEYQQTSLF
jgi:hypothetical protein